MSIALNAYLKPLRSFLDLPLVSELCINKPGELWLEESGTFTQVLVPELTENHLRFLADLIAEDNHKNLSQTKPLLSATLPSGERCQFVLPPACEKGQIICSIRKPSVADLTLSDWALNGAFDSIKTRQKQRLNQRNTRLNQLMQEGRWEELLALAVRARCNIIISGGTSTAKTTLLNSCLKELNAHERLITIEGVREVKTTLENRVHLLANEDEDHPLSASMLDLLKVCFRLRPDRIFLSELRAREAYPYLRACISGHPGSLTTVHADSIASAKEQLCFMLSESPELSGAGEVRLRSLIQTSIQVFVQMTRDEHGARLIEDIELEGVVP
ncbi:P-type DNA transfer ATPase VirB11 [Legionella lytica]|uniref:Type IV secretion system protein n=1 Tax=Legionella lytica TaxID=96232 RepID=A0ABW8DB90_9GAMM